MRLSDLERRVLLSAVGFSKRHFEYDVANRDIFPVSYDKISELFDSLSLGVESGLDAARRPVCLRLDAPGLQLLEGLLCDQKIENSQQQLAVRKLRMVGEDRGCLAPNEIDSLSQYLLDEAPETPTYDRLVSSPEAYRIADELESQITVAEWSSYPRGSEVDCMEMTWNSYERQIIAMTLKVATQGHISATSMYFRELIRNGAFDFGCSLYVSLATEILP